MREEVAPLPAFLVRRTLTPEEESTLQASPVALVAARRRAPPAPFRPTVACYISLTRMDSA
jgi:hypothetical protein